MYNYVKSPELVLLVGEHAELYIHSEK